MGEIVNLRRVRKDKARAEKDKLAEANRLAHGTPKALRKLDKAKRELDRARLDARKLDDAD